MTKGLSLQERKQRLMEECAACAAGGGAMTVGADGFQGSADATGPTAGVDALLGKTLKKLKKKDDKKVEESYEYLPVDKMRKKVWLRGKKAKQEHELMKSWQDIDREGLVGGADKGVKSQKGKIEKLATKNKKMSSTIRNHDSLDSRFKELENQDRGEKKKLKKKDDKRVDDPILDK